MLLIVEWITSQVDLFNAILASYEIYRNAMVTFPENDLATKWRHFSLLEPGMRPGILLFFNTDCNSSLEWHIIEIPTAVPMSASMPDSVELVLNTVCLLPSGGNVKCRPRSWKRWFYPMNDLSHRFQWLFQRFLQLMWKGGIIGDTHSSWWTWHGQLGLYVCLERRRMKLEVVISRCWIVIFSWFQQ